MNASDLTKAIAAARSQGRPARIPYLTAGFPSLEGFWRALTELSENGADIIEIGVPFSDPVADGPVVAAAGLRALENGVDLAFIIEGLKKHPQKVPTVLMSYANPLVQYAWPQTPPVEPSERLALSLELLAGELAEASVAGVIVPDLPFEESGPLSKALKGVNLALIPLVGPNTSAQRMRLYESEASGYVYVVSVLGTTGVREGLPPEAIETIARARSVFSLPIALGFGIKEPAQLAALGAEPDAVIFGSALLKHLDSGKSCREFMAPWL
ncbi:MAG: tryptophan synthase subunit alpha [Deltaproteobacteria bacterium]|jgi:tryptophan synthase alpha chain|nr:tryptophan synthase subunit alpha [Deltaproteobacteria bacterium]